MSTAPETLRLGTRQSQLALTQSQHVADALMALHHHLKVDLVPIVTRGDREPGDLSLIGGKGLFTQELEEGLLAEHLDLAVHSLKDLPVAQPAGLAIAAFPPRVDPRDGLISTVAQDLDQLPPGATLLTGSQRRRAQILDRRPDLNVQGIRGNVDTRLRKWKEQGDAGVILAMAGLERLGLEGVPANPLDPEVMIPAPGQGILAVQVKQGSRAEELCQSLNDASTARAAAAERRIVEAFGGDCTLPLAAWATEQNGKIRIAGCLATLHGEQVARGTGEGATADEAAEACLQTLHDDGAAAILKALGK